jgi:hypothetical protein
MHVQKTFVFSRVSRRPIKLIVVLMLVINSRFSWKNSVPMWNIHCTSTSLNNLSKIWDFKNVCFLNKARKGTAFKSLKIKWLKIFFSKKWKENELKGTQEKSFKMATKEKIGFGRHSLADRYSFFSLKIEKKTYVVTFLCLPIHLIFTHLL